jgi:hypothetical protein
MDCGFTISGGGGVGGGLAVVGVRVAGAFVVGTEVEVGGGDGGFAVVVWFHWLSTVLVSDIVLDGENPAMLSCAPSRMDKSGGQGGAPNPGASSPSGPSVRLDGMKIHAESKRRFGPV